MKDYGNLVNKKEITEIDVTVKEIILTTIELKIPHIPNCSKYDHTVDNSTDLMRIFLDMNLSILGSDQKTYVDYCHRIRLQY